MDEIKLSERKQKILRALIDDYIKTAEPISSSRIKDNCLPQVSSATIRSELVALEELGFLVQPHVSAGRIPSTKAYRYYVDNLVPAKIGEAELNELRLYFDDKQDEIEEVIRSTAKVISDVTNYTSIIVLGGVEQVRLKEVKLVDIGSNTALVIVITDSGVLKDKMIDLPEGLAEDYFVAANDMLNEIFAGKTVGEVTDNESLIEGIMEEFRNVCNDVVELLFRYRNNREGKMYLEGTDKIFKQKEFEDIGNVKNFLSVVNTKEKIYSLIDGDDDIEMSIKIGKDESGEENMAVVTARCVIAGKEIGHAAVIGPERMDYKKVIGVLNGITKIIEGIKKE